MIPTRALSNYSLVMERENTDSTTIAAAPEINTEQVIPLLHSQQEGKSNTNLSSKSCADNEELPMDTNSSPPTEPPTCSPE
ncbi:hypothetical protein PIB30_063229 [Stylosanthes scabra]|uniref:Uncharacterized protein n=1 Tax=Stylosanthes scabra TaxID=79078 RepID=A0ABU6SLC5_9FABA|nr:hypothetical protein [Stylosanthes scabra]